MTQSEQLLEFIDGTLGEDAEQSLFQTLAHERELRAELRQHVSIGRAVQSDRDAFAPPGFVDTAVLTGIGYSIGPVAAATSGVGFLRGLGGLLGAFILGVILAGGGTYWAMSGNVATAGGTVVQKFQKNDTVVPKTSSMVTTATATSPGTPTPSSAGTIVPPSSMSIASSGTPATSVMPMPTAAPPRSNHRNVSFPTSVPVRSRHKGVNLQANATSRNSKRANTQIPSTFMADPLPVKSGGTTVETVDMRQGRSLAPATLPSGDTSPDGFAPQKQVDAPPTVIVPVQEVPPPQTTQSSLLVELRAQSATSIASNSARAVSAVFPENFAAGAYYKVDRNLSLGIEGGRERYTQSLYFNNNDTLLIEQRPSLNWGGLSARYTYLGLAIPQLQPFIQMTAGITSTGPMLRGRMGARYSLPVFGREMALLFAGETSSLFYRFNGQYSASGRWGITYGLELSLW